MLINRRKFLTLGSLATGTIMLPKFLKAFESPLHGLSSNKILVVLQLSGGNDGLNTVIPVRNDIYYRERPGLSISREKSLSLNDETGLHPSLSHLKDLYDEGNLAVLNNVGYPNPDRSHFRSMEIWQTASSSDQVLNSGWLGRYLDAECLDCSKPTQVLEMDDMLSLALSGEKMKGIALRDPKRLYDTSRDPFFKEMLNAGLHVQNDDPSSYLYKVMAETISSADYIFQQSKLRPGVTTYPNSEIGKDLKTIASLISSDINTRVYYVSIGSFDTHV
ncbi:MAG TPA: twin-arginine translocation pathway signal, partial [Puia sp.]|nr:twin-arginine translocation pathway signal [Puia sp.]